MRTNSHETYSSPRFSEKFLFEDPLMPRLMAQNSLSAQKQTVKSMIVFLTGIYVSYLIIRRQLWTIHLTLLKSQYLIQILHPFQEVIGISKVEQSFPILSQDRLKKVQVWLLCPLWNNTAIPAPLCAAVIQI